MPPQPVQRSKGKAIVMFGLVLLAGILLGYVLYSNILVTQTSDEKKPESDIEIEVSNGDDFVEMDENLVTPDTEEQRHREDVVLQEILSEKYGIDEDTEEQRLQEDAVLQEIIIERYGVNVDT